MAAKKNTSKRVAAKPVADVQPQERMRITPVAIAWIAGLVLLFVGVILAVKFLAAPVEDLTYNGYPFVRAPCPGTDEECYFAELKINDQAYTIQFYHHPTEVEDVLFEYTALEALRSVREQPNPSVIIGVPDGAPGQIGIAGSQLGRILGERYGILGFAVTAQVIGSGEGLVDCDDARTNTAVIAFKQGPDSISVPSPNCIVIGATDADRSIAVADAFVYRIFGIIRTVRDTPAS